MITFKEYYELEEGVNDPSIFKAVFLAGGPGSGKSFIVGKSALTALGMKVVNVDDAFENAMKKAKMELTPEKIFSDKGQALRGKAVKLTGTKQKRFIDGRLGLVVDGTGKDYNKIKTQSDALRKIGYETAMIFINTDLETALDRNRKRARSLPDDQVEKMWKAVQSNVGKFQGHFGKNFLVLDNSDGADWNQSSQVGYKWATKFSKTPITRPVAKKWMERERGQRK